VGDCNGLLSVGGSYFNLSCMLTFELVAQYITIVIIESMLMANFMSIFLTPSVAENHHRGTNSESSAKISFLLLHPLDRLA